MFQFIYFLKLKLISNHINLNWNNPSKSSPLVPPTSWSIILSSIFFQCLCLNCLKPHIIDSSVTSCGKIAASGHFGPNHHPLFHKTTKIIEIDYCIRTTFSVIFLSSCRHIWGFNYNQIFHIHRNQNQMLQQIPLYSHSHMKFLYIQTLHVIPN